MRFREVEYDNCPKAFNTNGLRSSIKTSEIETIAQQAF